MAQDNAESGFGYSWGTWVLLIAASIAILFFVFKSCNEKNDVIPEVNTGFSTMNSDDTMDVYIAKALPGAPILIYSEITDTNVVVKGDDQVTVYNINEKAIFSKKDGRIERNSGVLKQVANSIDKRFPDGKIRIYSNEEGAVDDNYSANFSHRKAQAIKNWLMEQANISERRISIRPSHQVEWALKSHSENQLEEYPTIRIAVSD